MVIQKTTVVMMERLQKILHVDVVSPPVTHALYAQVLDVCVDN